jgi:predicted N-formylglutamate amidohydrolase
MSRSSAALARPTPEATPEPETVSHPVEVVEGSVRSGVILLCDHASNAVPPDLGDLGVPPDQFQRHIAYDIGAATVTRGLARRLDAPALLTTFSRLVIDPNRGRDDPTLVMRLSDGAVVPGNRRIDAAEVARRIARFYDPYDAAIDAAVARAMAEGVTPAVVSVHSFTPSWRGRPRPWHVGLLWDVDRRMARPLIEGLEAEGDLIVGDNEPYDGALAGDTLDRHATRRGLANALIEIRQDLIADEAGAEEWAERFARLLRPLLADPSLRAIEHHPTRTRERLRRH